MHKGKSKASGSAAEVGHLSGRFDDTERRTAYLMHQVALAAVNEPLHFGLHHVM